MFGFQTVQTIQRSGPLLKQLSGSSAVVACQHVVNVMASVRVSIPDDEFKWFSKAQQSTKVLWLYYNVLPLLVFKSISTLEKN
jgi:hypothetical protein